MTGWIRLWVCGLALTATASGCGGRLTQEDMMRNAIRRAPDDDAVAPSGDEYRNPPPRVGASAGTDAVDNATTQTIVPATQPDRAQTVSHEQLSPPVGASAKPVEGDSSTRLQEERNDDLSVVASEPRTPQASRLQAIEKMTRIGAAFEAYVKEKRHYPPPAIYRARNEPLLSWRVALLPFLGHAALYKQFKLSEPWNSKHNQTFVTQIPPTFRVTGLEVGKTNFLLPVGAGAAFTGKRGLALSEFEDGAENTAILLEVDHDRAVDWTAPMDHHVNLREPTVGLGALREGGFLIVWGGGSVNWVTLGTPTRHLQAIYTPDAGDGILASQVGLDPLADLEPVNPDNLQDRGLSVAGAESPATVAVLGSRPATDVKTPPAARQRGPTVAERHAVPNADELREAKDLLRDLYQLHYRQASTSAAKHLLANQMLRQLEEIEADIAGQYALLDTVRQISIQAGAVETALQAVDALSTRFDIDSIGTRFETLASLARSAAGQQSQKIVQASEEAYQAAFLAEDYEMAEKLCGIALAALQESRNLTQAAQLQRARQQAQAANRSHRLAERAIRALDDDPHDQNASTMLGKYLCLVREDWSNGLVALAAGDDPRLTPLAERELDQPLQPEDQVELGDAWWRVAEKASVGERRSLFLRALHWYRQAMPHLPPSLARIKIERRLEQAEQEWLAQFGNFSGR